MAASGRFGTPLTRTVAPYTGSTEGHRRRQWQGSHGGLAPFRPTPHEDHGPVGSSTKGANGR
eukprot:6650433-Pyramimonas_sp.AAC.1